MEYLGDKITVAQSQMSGWVGNVRRSLHGALSFLRTGQGEDGTGDFKRTNSLRSLASRSRESIRRFSLRSQQRLSLRRRTAPNTPTAEDESKDHETDSQYGTWETGLRSEDLTPATPSSESNLSPSHVKATSPQTPHSPCTIVLSVHVLSWERSVLPGPDRPELLNRLRLKEGPLTTGSTKTPQ
uniref:Uncharacterized protein n=1 Tax=Periophthalmus magnuspinnatus TaxID=409849 RepID=A0A3B3Z8P9_9GOBI